MAKTNSTRDRRISAAAYIRHSSGKQEKSPAEQRAEIDKLAERHDCRIVRYYDDAAISGDSDSDKRPGLADLLNGAKAGTFKVLLVWHTNRLTREHPMDSMELYNSLRKAGVGLISCCEGVMDPSDFSKSLLLYIGQKGNHDYLPELSAKVLRGKLANAKQGRWNGGRANYGMDRALFDPQGRMVCRLKPGEYMTRPGHTIKLVPTDCKEKLQAVRYAFQRFDEADLSLRALAREMHVKGFPAPRAGGWHDKSVYNILTARVYVGAARWNHHVGGKYNQVRAGELVAVNSKKVARRKQPDEAIEVAGAHKGFIDRDLFDRVQRKLSSQRRRHGGGRHAPYPLTGLIVCGHCDKPMQVHTSTPPGYVYREYACKTYLKYGAGGKNATCGSQRVDAGRVHIWLIRKLQSTFLGAQRAALVQQIKLELKAAAKGGSGDTERLQKRAANLDREVARLVKAIRTVDADELAEELAIVKAERDRVRAELARSHKASGPADVDSEAERIANGLAQLAENLNVADPAVLREAMRQFVSRIVCEWESYQTCGGNTRRRFVRGTVELRPIPGYDYCEDQLDDGPAPAAGD